MSGKQMSNVTFRLVFLGLNFTGKITNCVPGPSPLIWVYLAELLPREYKVLSGIIVASANIPVFIMTKTFPSLLNILSPPGTYWLLASIAASSNIFYAFFMPETKGKSPLEVKQIFMKN